MQVLNKKYILPALFLAGLIFFLAPTNNANAAIETGAPCSTDAQCPSAPQQRCLTAQHTLGPGHCGFGCRSDAGCTGAINGWKCTDIIGEFGICAETADTSKPCNSDSNCTPPDRCLTDQHTLGAGHCGIGCKYDAQCPNGWKCNDIIGEFGLCKKPPSASSEPSGGASAGASVNDLKAQAQSTLNKANFSSPADLINRAIKMLLAFIGSLALVLYVYAGFLWMSASGSSEHVDATRSSPC